MSTEPYGTTPLPAKGVSIRYDPGDVWDVAQQPKSQQIAAYEGVKNDESVHGATVLDVNAHFVIYAVKKGLIRILHRHSTLRTLFRGHEGQTVTDIQIFLDGDVLGSVGTNRNDGTSTVIIWRVFERTPEIMSEKLLEITTSAYTISRLIWHPFNPNQFWIIHTVSTDDKKKVASLVDTTRISTLPHEVEQHAVCMYHMPSVIMDGVMELAAPAAYSLTDLAWSERDSRHVMTVGAAGEAGGEIRLWDLRKVDQSVRESTLLPACICAVQEDLPLSRCKFLPHECPRDQPSKRETAYTNCFLTAANNNTVVTLWSPFGEDGPPTKLQIFGLENPSPAYLLDICYGPSPPDGPPPSLFVLMADQSEGKLFSWHLQSEWQDQTVVALVGCDYVVPFVTSYPMFSCSTQVQPAADISEDELTDQGGLVFDMKLFSYQSTVVQCLILTSFMCLPPGSQWNPSTTGVTVEDLQLDVASQPDMAVSEDFEMEEYDIGEDEEGGEEEYSEPPAASSLPVPDGLDSPAAAATVPAAPGGANSFANWLGALAVKAPGNPPIPPPPPVAQIPTASGGTTTMLTPADLFPNHPSIVQVNESQQSVSPPPQQTQEDSIRYVRNRYFRLSHHHFLLFAPRCYCMLEYGGNTHSKKKNQNWKGKSPARSRSPTRNKGGNKQTNGGKKGQQQAQGGDQVSILQRKSDEEPASSPQRSPPPPGIDSAGVSVSDKTIAALFQQQDAAIAREFQKALKNEITSTLVPLIDQKVQECFTRSIQPVLASIERIGKDGVQVDHDRLVDAITAQVAAPLRAAFADNMKNVMIPAFESVTGQMFAQISTSLEDGMAQKDGVGATNKLDELSNQLSTVTAMVKQLSSEVELLRSVVTDKGMRARAESLASSVGVSAAAEQQQVLEQEVLSLLGQRQYEAAFTKALSASTVEMALFVCRHSDLADVLGGNSPALSQPILLCLMHQLGTSVVTATDDGNNLQTELAWLQEVSLSINPSDDSMKRHLPGVLQQLVAGINDKMARTNQHEMRRPLQRLLQVLRGVQV